LHPCPLAAGASPNPAPTRHCSSSVSPLRPRGAPALRCAALAAPRWPGTSAAALPLVVAAAAMLATTPAAGRAPRASPSGRGRAPSLLPSHQRAPGGAAIQPRPHWCHSSALSRAATAPAQGRLGLRLSKKATSKAARGKRSQATPARAGWVATAAPGNLPATRMGPWPAWRAPLLSRPLCCWHQPPGGHRRGECYNSKQCRAGPPGRAQVAAKRLTPGGQARAARRRPGQRVAAPGGAATRPTARQK